MLHLRPFLAAMLLAAAAPLAVRAEGEVKILRHYLPQDLLEEAVSTENWVEIPLDKHPLVVKWRVMKGDFLRVWTGGVVDRGGDQPGSVVGGPEGAPAAGKPELFALSSNPDDAFAVLFKNEEGRIWKAPPAGKPIEIPIARDAEKIWIGFNDLKGKYNDNHVGKGRRHESDPLWVRIELVRIQGE